jgi:hypothetical protein
LSSERADLRIIAEVMKLACAALVAATACKHDATPPPAAVAPDLELLSPGAVPRPARYHLAKGQTAALELQTEMTISVGGHDNAIPALVMQLDLATVDVATDGTAKVRTTIANATTVGGPPQLQERLGELRGIAIAATLSPDGKLHDAAADLTGKKLSPAVTDQMQSLTQSFEQIAMPLPLEPIGVGAKWRTKRSLKQGGMSLTTVTTIEVNAFDGDHLGFTMKSELTGPDQDVETPGGKIHMRDIRGSGSGHGTIDLAKMAMTGEIATSFHAEMASSERNEPLDMTIKLTTRPR